VCFLLELWLCRFCTYLVDFVKSFKVSRKFWARIPVHYYRTLCLIEQCSVCMVGIWWQNSITLRQTFAWQKLNTHYFSRWHSKLSCIIVTCTTRLLSNLRPTTRECVGHFWSGGKDGRHTIQSAIDKNCKLHANFTALCCFTLRE